MRGFKNDPSINLFTNFDPFLSFSDEQFGVKNRSFINGAGEYNAEHPNLWRLGREAYIFMTECFGVPPTENEFYWLADKIIEFEQNEVWLKFANDVINQDNNSLQFDRDSPPIKDIRSVVNSSNCDEGWFTNAIMQILKPLIVNRLIAPDAIPDIEGLLWGISLLWIDDALRDFQHGIVDSTALDCVQQSAASAKIFREAIDSSRSAVSATNRRGATAKNAPTNTLKEHFLSEWRLTGQEYKGISDFARIISARDGIQLDQRTLRKWISEDNKQRLSR
ncbi:hypothetical protein [Pseudomonas sp. TNT3]|uniref:hypothetical protein n=1 Tax=Pseudomonas sp. TNT3 TaxID=2654097 RepID=UPI001391EA3C|nr:hypothetical protein [Pseudomonas sp. TNT3]KAI2693095.1 hypothetical protein GBC55_007740 [Pseudomonas sp. TNT3]